MNAPQKPLLSHIAKFMQATGPSYMRGDKELEKELNRALERERESVQREPLPSEKEKNK